MDLGWTECICLNKAGEKKKQSVLYCIEYYQLILKIRDNVYETKLKALVNLVERKYISLRLLFIYLSVSFIHSL